MDKQPQIGRVRSLFIDFDPRETQFPRRGDRVSSGTSLYYVLRARKVKRRSPAARPRIQMVVIKKQDMADGLSNRLIGSAIRGHGGSFLFEFTWYSRERKTQTFEQYMRRHDGRHS